MCTRARAHATQDTCARGSAWRTFLNLYFTFHNLQLTTKTSLRFPRRDNQLNFNPVCHASNFNPWRQLLVRHRIGFSPPQVWTPFSPPPPSPDPHPTPASATLGSLPASSSFNPLHPPFCWNSLIYANSLSHCNILQVFEIVFNQSFSFVVIFSLLFFLFLFFCGGGGWGRVTGGGWRGECNTWNTKDLTHYLSVFKQFLSTVLSQCLSIMLRLIAVLQLYQISHFCEPLHPSCSFPLLSSLALFNHSVCLCGVCGGGGSKWK